MFFYFFLIKIHYFMPVVDGFLIVILMTVHPVFCVSTLSAMR